MLFRIVTVSNRIVDFVEMAIHHYDKNLKSIGGRLELILLRRQKKFKDLNEQKKYDTDRILEWLNREQGRAINIALDPKGEAIFTIELVSHVKEFTKVNFIIGGDVGLAMPHPLWNIVNLKIVISPWTISHQLCIALCAEQAWRILSIIKGHPYHK